MLDGAALQLTSTTHSPVPRSRSLPSLARSPPPVPFSPAPRSLPQLPRSSSPAAVAREDVRMFGIYPGSHRIG
jgi:hypothetical protein